jgi:hypothetical protein
MSSTNKYDENSNKESLKKNGTLTRRKFAKISLTAIAVGGIAVFLKKVTPPIGVWGANFPINKLVHSAFRLTDHCSLLNLDYYFVNCEYRGGKIWAKYGPHENYMVVRLPQQHIAEQSFDDGSTGPYKAATYISNYSYLVFRILFPEDGFWESIASGNDGKYTSIGLTKEDLLNWNNEEKFRLVVRQDLTESLFELCKPEYYNNPPSDIHIIDSLKKKDPRIADSTELGKLLQDHLENRYPFQQKQKSANHDSLKINIDSSIYDINRIPKAYGDPITAIELPWRLIISPKLPDSSRFKFKWDIPPTAIEQNDSEKKANKQRHKLWTATLSIAERNDTEYLNKKRSEAKKNDEDHQQASTGSLNDVINQLELMILGSPDYLITSDQYNDILPTGAHRKDLVALYIKLKVLARTEKLVLSAIGATVKIHLKNEKIEDALKRSIGVIEWNQIISFGRDEKVEVSTLFLEAEFGHKMAYIQIAERQLRDGEYVLIKTPYIMPLDISKDYTNHITQTTDLKDKDGSTQVISRFNTPFKKITFLETKPKRLIMNKKDDGTQEEFNQDQLNQTKTSFQFEAIDWHDNVIRFTKEINAITFNYALSSISGIDGATNTSLRSKAFGNKDIYVPEPSISIPDTSKFILKDINVIESDPKNDNQVKIDSLDKTLGLIKSNTKYFTRALDSVYLHGSPLPETIKIEDYLNEVDEYYDNFFQYIKNIVFDLYSKTNATSSDIQTKIQTIDFEFLKAFLIEHYLFIGKTNFSKIVSLYQKILFDNKLILENEDLLTKNFQIIFSKKEKIILDDFNLYLKASFDSGINLNLQNDPLTDQNIQDILNIVEKTYKDEFLKWIIAYNCIFSTNTILEESSKQLIRQLATDFPEISKTISKLQILFNQGKDKANALIENITERLELFYQLEQKAKDIPGLILLQKQKIGYAIREKFDEEINKNLGKSRKELEDDVANATGQVKKSLSELESEYIIFKGGLRQASNKTFDFFHDYAIIPQVQQAKVYVSALNKLVNEDLPISINYAKDYLENQVRDAEFEVKQNAAMVFAEVQQYSREQVKGLIQKVGDKMPGFNIEVPAHYLTYARNPQELVDSAVENVRSQLGLPDNFKKQITDYSRDLIFISDEVKNAVKVIDDLKNADPKKYFKDLGAKLFGSIGLEDILDIGFDLPRLTELPDRLIYQVSTDKFKNFQAAFVVFKPNAKAGGAPTRLELFVSKSLKNAQEYHAYTQLNNFSVGVVIGGTEVLTITFEQFKITSSPNQPKKTDVSITDVKLGGPLEFIAELAKRFMAPGNGMRIKPGPRSLTVDYTIVLPDIKAPAFNFRNLQLVIGVNIPYDPSTLKAISFMIGVNKPEDKFLVSAGTYGGRGHFQIRATPKGIEQIDIAIELGAYASIDLGIGKGEVFLFFGFWFVTGKDDTGQNFIKAVAYVICAGSATVLGFITIGVSVLIALTYIKRGGESLFYGEAVVTYSVKIAFFKKEFSLRYYKEIAGSSKGNNTQSLQTGAILLNATAPGGVSVNNDFGAMGFEDVFENENALEQYLSCFA